MGLETNSKRMPLLRDERSTVDLRQVKDEWGSASLRRLRSAARMHWAQIGAQVDAG
jgi:hypothetical protein